MELVEIKNRIQDTIKRLPPQKLEIALDFLEDLKQSDEAETDVLLNEPGFLEEYRQAKEDIRTGDTISWENIKMSNTCSSQFRLRHQSRQTSEMVNRATFPKQ